MTIENILYLIITGAAVLLAIIVAYYLFQLLSRLLKTILYALGKVAQVLFSGLYLLLTVAISAVGLVGVGAFAESVLQNKPLHLWGLGIGSILLFLGSSGFVSFIKNGFSFGERKVSRSRYAPSSHSSGIVYGLDPEEQRQREMEELRAKSQADKEAELEAKYAREAQERDEWQAEQARIARENWEADQEAGRIIRQKANEDFRRSQEEAEAYNRQVMEDWKRQEEEREEYSRKVREERGW